jgi:hypothetical protein
LVLGGDQFLCLSRPNQLLIFSGETESFFIVGMDITAFTHALACPRAMANHEGLLDDRILTESTITLSSIANRHTSLANLPPPLVDFIVQILAGFFVPYVLRQAPT